VKSLVLLALLVPTIAYAGDGDGDEATADSVVVKVAPAKPKPKRLYVRLGVAFIDPLSSSSPLQLANVDGAASLAVKNGPIAGSGSTVDSATIPAAIIGYTLPVLHDRLSIETVLGTPVPVKFQATGTLASKSLAPTALGLPTGVPALGPQLGEAQGVPPVVTAVYALRDHGPLVPYAGAGVAMLFAYDAKVTNPVLTMAGSPDMSISPAPGLVFQGGLDARIWKRIYARIDVKFILLETHAEVDHIRMQTPDLPLFGTVEVGSAKMDVWVNPLIIQAGLGTNF
jgi:outer membrane protein W